VEEIRKPSKGDELIRRLRDKTLIKDVSINELTEEETPRDSDESRRQNKTDFASLIKNGVEVIDARAIPKENEPGIPYKEPRKTWDKL